MSTTETERPSLEVTCVGWRLNSKDALMQGWQFPDGEVHFWGKGGLSKYARPGDVYRITFSGPEMKSAFTKGEFAPRYLRHFDADEVTDWVVQSEAAEAAAAADKYNRKRAEDDAFKAMLRPLREQYARLPRDQRRALLAAVIAEITWQF